MAAGQQQQHQTVMDNNKSQVESQTKPNLGSSNYSQKKKKM